MISAKNICDKIEKLISMARIPFPSIPAVLLACSVVKRPGLSAMLMASEIIRRYPEAGAYSGPLPDGSQNVSEALEVIRCETIVDMIKKDAKVEAVIAPGGIQIQTSDGMAGTNINFVKAEGGIS